VTNTIKKHSRRDAKSPGNSADGDPLGGFRLAVKPFTVEWRARATTAREQLADSRAAQIIENVVADLERFAASLDSELVSPEEGASWSGFTIDHLARLCREGKLRNYGRKGRPLYAKTELPKKASRRTALRSPQGSDIVPHTRQQIARAAITPFVGGRDG
jgi:hypothetical protein